MREILSLEELLKEENVSERFGLKVDGIVKLKKILNESKSEELQYVTTPDLFALNNTVQWDDPELEFAYLKYVSQFKKPKIILARSSDPNEKPGKFETASSLYIPKDPKQSFNNWIIAAKKVRESGAKAIIGQELIGELTDFVYDHEYIEQDSEGYPKKEYITIKSFGGNMTSFFMNSTNVVLGDHPTIVACFGLASKIARGDMDVSLIQDSIYGLKIINLNHCYENESFADYKQRTLDIITLENPSKISTIKCTDECQGFRTVVERSVVPFADDYRFIPIREGESFSRFAIWELFEALNEIEKKVKTNIELEGCIDDTGIHIFQLREYELPKRNFQGIIQKDNINNILKENEWGIGFNQFIGDIYISKNIIDVPDNATLWYNGNIYKEEFSKFKKYKQLIIPFYKSDGLYAGSHSFGRTVQTMVELEKLGVKSIAIALDPIDSYNSIRHVLTTKPNLKFEQQENTIILRNMTAECNGSDVQIYYNK